MLFSRRFFAQMLATLTISVALTGAWAGEKLKIGTLPASDAVLLYAAQEDGIFKHNGLDVELISFRSALEIGAAMRSGELSGHYGDLINVFLQNAAGQTQAVAATMTRANTSQRNFALVTSPGAAQQFKTIADLKRSQPVETAMSANTIIDYLLTRLEETEKLPASTFKKTEIRQIPIRLQLLLSNRMTTALLPEPLASIVQARGGRVLWDDRGLTEPLAVVAFRKNAVNEAVIAAFRRSLTQAAKNIEADPEHYRALMVKHNLLPPKGADQYPMPRYSIYGTADLLPALPSAREIERVGRWMVKKGMITAIPTREAIVFP